MDGIVRVAIALGSNLGDRRGHLTWASDQLRRLLANLRVSAFIDTAPVGVPDPQPPYLNAAAVGDTTLGAAELLDALLAIERDRGRSRPAELAPRTLDLDLILYGDVVLEGDGLVIPHPRFRHRRFVLEPLAEIAPDLPDPVSGRSVGQLLAALDRT